MASDLSINVANGAVLPGEAFLAETPVLRSHAGTQPDLFLRWNAMPLATATLDVAVHLHGFSREGRAMVLSEKVGRSGLDLAGRTRATLALLPRGNWLRHYYYDFPALLAGGIDALVDDGVQRLARAMASASPATAGMLTVDRLILTAHSGGGMPAVDVIAGAHRPPDELYVFDGLYGRNPAVGDPLQGIDIIDRWLGERLTQEPQRQGALRVIYIEQQTGPFSRRVGELVARHLACADPALAETLARRYRVEAAVGVQHSQLAARCAPQLLAASDAEIDWWR
jgi:hypothetical protein